MTHFDKVRFVGFAIPTTPADMVDVGDPNGSGSVAGTYRALSDFDADVNARITVLERAVEAAKAELSDHTDSGVLTVFVVPEFFWHGKQGPYLYAPGDPDPAERILERLLERFSPQRYPGYLFAFGSVISAEVGDFSTVFSSESARSRNDIVRALGTGWRHASGPIRDVILDQLVNFIKTCHSYPLIEVRNRALIVSGAGIGGVGTHVDSSALTTEKYYCSNEDFLLWDIDDNPVVTEQMTGYRVLDISAGDFKSGPSDPFAIFRVADASSPVTVGVEVCLDHSDTRLRRGAAHSPWPARDDGIDLHIVPSCGMQLHPGSVAARTGGWAFNCDGQYRLGSLSDTGAQTTGIVGGVACTFADYTSAADPVFQAHTQLARVRGGFRGAEQNREGSRDAEFADDCEIDVRVVPLPQSPEVDSVFAGGAGALHLYNANSPLPLFA